VLAVEAGDAPSLAEREDVATLLEEVPDNLVSAVLVEGEALRSSPPVSASPDIAATITAEAERLEPVELALIGITAGGPVLSSSDDEDAAMPTPPAEQAGARFVAVLLMEDEEAAEAAPEVIEERLETGQSLAVERPYSDFFTDWSVEAVPDAPVVVVEAAFNEQAHAGVWLQMLYRRDLGFLAW
jgi:hypothetical protein